MKDKALKVWNSLSVGQGVALAGLFGALAYFAVRIPAETWERIASKDPAELGVAAAAFLLAFGGVFAKAKETT